jgi:ribosome-associated translation inhibitor RaiA
MRLEVRRRGVAMTDELRAYLRERLRQALGRFGRHIDVVRVYLRDVNGPRGGVAMKCRVVVELSGLSPVVVTGTNAAIFAAVTGAAGRAGFAVKRRVKRRLARQRRRTRPGRRRAMRAVSGGVT